MQAEGIAHVSYLPRSRPKGFIPNCQSRMNTSAFLRTGPLGRHRVQGPDSGLSSSLHQKCWSARPKSVVLRQKLLNGGRDISWKNILVVFVGCLSFIFKPV